MSKPSINIEFIARCANMGCRNEPHQGAFTIVSFGNSSIRFAMCSPCASQLKKNIDFEDQISKVTTKAKEPEVDW